MHILVGEKIKLTLTAISWCVVYKIKKKKYSLSRKSYKVVNLKKNKWKKNKC